MQAGRRLSKALIQTWDRILEVVREMSPRLGPVDAWTCQHGLDSRHRVRGVSRETAITPTVIRKQLRL